MLGVEDYGSDNDNSGDETPIPSTSTTAQLPSPSKKSTFSLPPPSNAASTSKPKPKRGPKKITIGLPELTGENHEDERPAAKKPRLDAGAGKSSLLTMLPAPKQKAPVLPAPERVLGGGHGPGLVFNASRPSQSVAEDRDIGVEDGDGEEAEQPVALPESAPSIPFLPPSLKKGRTNISVEETHVRPPQQRNASLKVPAAPGVDFFSLGSSSSVPSSHPKPPTSLSPSPAPSTSLSSAPQVSEFTPPEPTPTDAYPGYYLLPTGSWAAYDSAYYQKFYKKWQAEYNAHVRALEKGVEKGFEGAEREGGVVGEVDAGKEMERAKKEVQEREERKALTHGAEGAPAAPRMNIKGAKLGGRARSRHQLSALLTEAYENREALEERIAEGRRNRKEAGNKYGF